MQVNRHRIPLPFNCAGWALAFAAVVAGFASPPPAHAATRCADLVYGSAAYQNKMDELAIRAKLPDAAWNRYHEMIVAGLCGGKAAEVDEIVDAGSVTAGEAQRIAAALGKRYRPEPVLDTGRSYASAKAELITMGICNACADNIAQYYTRKPESLCAKLAQRAFDGDSRAIDQLNTFPDDCVWPY
jgi:hypothetical protein